jgi:hypothetical protein
MNKIIFLLLISINLIAQENIHESKIISVFNLGQKEFVILADLVNEDIYKSSVCDKGTFNIDEIVQLKIINNNKGELIKSNINKNIYCFKQNPSFECVENNFCLKKINNNILIVKYEKNDFALKYTGIDGDNKTISHMEIVNKIDGIKKKIINTKFIENRTKINEYKFSTYIDVINEANKHKSKIELNDLKSSINYFNDLLSIFTEYYSNEYYNNFGISITYHYSILKTIERSLITSEKCDCLPSPFYLDTINQPFYCLKDFKIKKESIIKIYNDNVDYFKRKYDENTISNLFKVLNECDKNEVSLEDIYFTQEQNAKEMYIQYLGSSGIFCWLGSGSSLGCCGNYNGCCKYRHYICLYHDIVCINCKPKAFCGPQCNPN